jgi:hypothetical protein
MHDKDSLNSEENQAVRCGSLLIFAGLGNLDFQANFHYHKSLFERKPGRKDLVDVYRSPIPEGTRK